MQSSTIPTHYRLSFLWLPFFVIALIFVFSYLSYAPLKTIFEIVFLLHHVFHIVTVIFFATICYMLNNCVFKYSYLLFWIRRFLFLLYIFKNDSGYEQFALCETFFRSITLVSLIRCWHFLLVKVEWSWEYPQSYLLVIRRASKN